jgi:hypothetical protein
MESTVDGGSVAVVGECLSASVESITSIWGGSSLKDGGVDGTMVVAGGAEMGDDGPGDVKSGDVGPGDVVNRVSLGAEADSAGGL